ncbi:MAG: hypothetical protein CV081_06465 [Nitrospira sp. LK265]|nr:hypothetical protein [Nitrospira sp.]NGZ60129.1 hypothetical protein [Nitrospira sp. LK265]
MASLDQKFVYCRWQLSAITMTSRCFGQVEEVACRAQRGDSCPGVCPAGEDALSPCGRFVSSVGKYRLNYDIFFLGSVEHVIQTVDCPVPTIRLVLGGRETVDGTQTKESA